MEQELIRYIAENLVNDPSQVEISKNQTPQTTIIELRVAPDDMGRVIGKNGRVANAMRSLLKATARRRQRISLEIE
ncbi:KH domain-containing protein [Anaerolineales bacterium]